ncbi:hypothetical protein CLIB1444_01S13300 [[Candida] jaroonii]|uniref:Uncharacterized protein n=1 Tax=[Candida] jaroonii TaxID=467808 RepID=A0ACA9Y196_9ASCO|nr:hypothetical protein CLIB1444_01S13300 [[Candida] jaroonii]
MKLFGSNQSFFDQERKRVEKLIKTPLLELVLEYLPHLQLTVQEQDDCWEIIAIKLNDIQFKEKIKQNIKDMEELPTLSGAFVKELFFTIMKEFQKAVYYFNMENKIYRAEIANPHSQQSTMFFAFQLPVKDAYTERDDIICCELFYLKALDVETKAKLAKERFYNNVKNGVDFTKQELERTKVDSDSGRLNEALEELKRLHKKIENLDRENKRLMELNQSLLEDMNRH